jgi:hypothetical protein
VFAFDKKAFIGGIDQNQDILIKSINLGHLKLINA